MKNFSLIDYYRKSRELESIEKRKLDLDDFQQSKIKRYRTYLKKNNQNKNKINKVLNDVEPEQFCKPRILNRTWLTVRSVPFKKIFIENLRIMTQFSNFYYFDTFEFEPNHFYEMDTKEKIEQHKLNQELEKLKQRYGISQNLTVRYLPGKYRIGQKGTTISGEVLGDTILVYDIDPDEAMNTLHHEFIEYLIRPIIIEYVKVINQLNGIISQQLYEKREEVIDKLRMGIMNHTNK